jgi:hypothetical protein
MTPLVSFGALCMAALLLAVAGVFLIGALRARELMRLNKHLDDMHRRAVGLDK